MNREILFRAKRIDNGKWVEGYLFIDNDINSYYIQGYEYYADPDGLQREGFSYKVAPSTVCQYTGKCDLREDKLFEGHIIKEKTDDGDIRMFVIEWDKGNCGFFARYINKKSGISLDDLGDFWIIGSIFDNPELLEVQG